MSYEMPNYLQGELREMLSRESDGANKRRLWAVIFGLTPMKDGNMWCVSSGPNIQEGVCAFGETPDHAIWNFEQAMYERIPMPSPRP